MMKVRRQAPPATLASVLLWLYCSIIIHNKNNNASLLLPICAAFRPQSPTTKRSATITSSRPPPAVVTSTTTTTTTQKQVSSVQNFDDDVRRTTRRRRNNTHNSNGSSVMIETTTKDCDDSDIDDHPSNENALSFRGQITRTSRPLAVSKDEKNRLIQFFQSPAARDTLFVSDAPPVPVTITKNNPELFRAWQMEAQRLGAAIPEHGPLSLWHEQNQEQQQEEMIMQLISNGISFSGLTVETTVFCGAKLIQDGNCNGDDGRRLPGYEFTMIQDRTNARGPKALLWIYNQVMGFVAKSNQRRNSNNRNNAKTTTSLCRVSLIENDDEEASLALHFESSFQVTMQLPPFLLKIMPVSKSRAEQQGSAAVCNFVEKGIVESLHRFETEFTDYCYNMYDYDSSSLCCTEKEMTISE